MQAKKDRWDRWREWVCDDGLSVAVSTCPQPVVAYQRLVVAQSVLVDVAQARCTTDTDTHANIIIIIIKSQK